MIEDIMSISKKEKEKRDDILLLFFFFYIYLLFVGIKYIEHIAYDISSILAIVIGILTPILVIYFSIKIYKKKFSNKPEGKKYFWKYFLGMSCVISGFFGGFGVQFGVSALKLSFLLDEPKAYLNALKNTNFIGEGNERWLKELKRLDNDAYLAEMERQKNEKSRQEQEKRIKEIAEKNAELAKNIRISGTVHCQSLVRKMLKSPYSAEFPWGMSKLAVVHNTQKTISLNGYVDSQNYYGAMIRSHFNCSLKYNGNDIDNIQNWTIQNIKIEE